MAAHVNNYAALQPGELAAAEREAARIYEAIRVRILWVPDPEPRPDPGPCGFPLRVLLLSRKMELQFSRTQALGDMVFGFITRETGRAYILTHRHLELARRLARRYSYDFPRLLGQTIAHEVGHLLSPTDSHADRGIMQAQHFGVRAYSASYFTPEQGGAIRARLAATATRNGDMAGPP